MNSLKKRIFLVVGICLSILIGSFAGVFLLNRNAKKVYAIDGGVVNVAKVKLYVDANDDVYAYEEFKRIEETSSVDIKNAYEYDTETNTYTKTQDTKYADDKVYFERVNQMRKIIEDGEIVKVDDERPFIDNLSNVNDKNVYIQVLDNEELDNVFLLKNANLEEEIYQDSIAQNHTYTVREYLLVQFQSSSSAKLLSLSVNAKLDGITNIDTLEKTSTDTVVHYTQLFDLTNTKNLDTNQAINEFDAQGLYTFTFTYNIEEDGTTTTGNVKTANFYLLSENYYINPNNDENILPRSNTSLDTVHQDDIVDTYNKIYNNNRNLNLDGEVTRPNNQYTEPRLFNTERIDYKYYINDSNIYPLEKDFFNYNNQNTVGYNGEEATATDRILYPTLKYDATRYNLSYTYTMYGLTTVVTTALDTTGEKPVLNVRYSDSTGVTNQSFELEYEDNGQVIANFQFDEVGIYVLSFDFVLNGTILNSQTSKRLFVKEENWDLLHGDNLNIFGYQLMHSVYKSENGATESELKDEETNLFADITNAYMVVPDIEQYIEDKLSAHEITTTNQAPLFFRYLASLRTNTNVDSTESFYYHYAKSGNGYEYQGKYSLTSNSRFTKSGLYVVVLTYNYTDYESLTDEGPKSYDGSKYQVFAFEVENIEPDVDFYVFNIIDTEKTAFDETNTYELKDNVYVLTEDVEYVAGKTYFAKVELKTGGFTNKSVTINWKEALENPFDVAPNITIFKQNFDVVNDATKQYNINYATNITNTFNKNDLNNGIIQVADSAIYMIRVDYGPCTYDEKTKSYIYSASITYRFIIDKEEIGTDGNNIEFYVPKLKKLDEEKIVNQNFALIYGKITEDPSGTTKIIKGSTYKNSGAKISVTYSFMPLNSAENIPEKPLDNGNYYLSNGTSINALNENIAYIPGEVGSSLNSGANVLTSDGIYIFKFVDEAGNEAIRYMMKDTSSPILIQYINEKYSLVPSSTSNQDNMVNQEALIIWGNYKAIKYDAEISSQELANAGYNFYSKQYFERLQDFNEYIEIIDFELVDISNAYEYKNQRYIRTTDTEYDTSKTYYQKADLNIVYEQIDVNNPAVSISKAYEFNSQSNIYFLTTDTSYISTKTYYQKVAYKKIDTNNTEIDVLNAYEYISSSNTYKKTIDTEYNKNIYLLVDMNTEYNNPDDGNGHYQSIKNTGITVYYVNENGLYTAPNSNYTSREKNAFTIQNNKENEHVFQIRLSDKIGNRFEGLVEMTFDHSQFQAAMTGLPSNNIQTISSPSNLSTSGDGSETRLYINSVSNKKSITFSWIDDIGDFKIDSIICEFYPLTFEEYKNGTEINKNYPYSAFPTNTFDLMTNTETKQSTSTVNGSTSLVTRTKTKTAINLVADDRYGSESSSLQGMYIVTRTYSGDASMEDYVRSYIFYIDRNNIISNNYDIKHEYVGSDIKALIGDEENRYLFKGAEFLQEFVSEYIFLTNKQPGTLSVPQYKYYYDDIDERILSTDNETATKIAVNRLNLYIDNEQYFGDETNYLIDTEANNATLYKIKIADNSNGNTNASPTLISFEVAVDIYAPVADFIRKDSTAPLTQGAENNISVNSTDVYLVWDDIAQDDVKAKIDEQNITITQVFEDGRTTLLYKITNGIINNNPANIQNLIEDYGTNQHCIDFSKFNAYIDGINCRVEVSLQYRAQNASRIYYGNYFKSTKIIYFDYEKPQSNFKDRFDNDQYLSKLDVSQAEFEDYNSAVNFENYSFVVTSDYHLSTPPRDSFWQYGLENAKTNPNDVELVWYRVYSKYFDDKGQNQQSIVPGDPRYTDTTQAPTRLRFNANLYITDDDGNTTRAYTQITKKLENFNFYDELYNNEQYAEIIRKGGLYCEIIEKDCADNYRIYTIQVLPDDEYELIHYLETEGDGADYVSIDKTLKLDEKNTNFEVNNQKIEIISFENLGEWFAIDVLNGSTNEKLTDTIYVSPISINGHMDIDTALSLVNSLIVDSEKVGKFFIINITSSRYKDITIGYHTPGIKYELDTVLRSTSLSLTIDPNKYGKVTYLKNLEVWEADNDGNLNKLLIDNNSRDIKSTYSIDDNAVTYIFTYSNQNIRNLWFRYTDNFGVEYQSNFILGITQTPFENMLIFNDKYIQNEDYSPVSLYDEENDLTIDGFDKFAEYYTSSQVVFEYQPRIYSGIKIYLIDELGEFNELSYQATDILSRNVKRINVFKPDEEFNLTDAKYLIIFEDTSGIKYQFMLHHYTKIADLRFIDDNGGTHNFDQTDDLYEPTISRVVYLKYDKYDTKTNYNIATYVTVTRTYININNVTITEQYGVVDDEFIFRDFGTYTITATNELGASKIYKFQYIKSDAIYYYVKANANGNYILLSPSNVKYDYNGERIDHYVSIYDAELDVNQKKNLDYVLVESREQERTSIWRIFSTNNNLEYSKLVAITKISTSSNILGFEPTITETFKDGEAETNYLTSKYLKSNAKAVTFKLPAYFEKEANLLKVRVVYENQDMGFINKYDSLEEIVINFTVAGYYKIYVYDLAGNQHSFNGSSYFELSLINNFVYNLNDERGIYNSIYNSQVKLTVTQKSNFVSNNGSAFTISAVLNGSPYVPVSQNGSYMFSSYGTYIVTLKGYINLDASGNPIDEVSTEIKFTILNPNEAKLMHEYIGLNGYEVTSIVKDDEDITNSIKQALGVSSIGKFAVSGLKDGIGGSGLYRITVSARLDDIVGERSFAYNVWINNDTDLLIVPNIKEGESTTGTLTLEMNLHQIYSKVGECQIKLNGDTFVEVNSSTAEQNKVSKYTINAYNRYNVTIETASGNTLLSFVVTKAEPLNSVAIIVIISVTLVVTALTITFILLRKKMRVR